MYVFAFTKKQVFKKVNISFTQNSPAVKKCAASKNAVVKKRCEIQSGGQEMAVMAG